MIALPGAEGEIEESMDIKKLIDGISRIKIGLITATIDGERIFTYLEAAQELIEKQPWIPVAERLPEGYVYIAR
ncbi:hypothetical protein [Lacrimispora sp.]|uniref:hypothetical protein n=1 Tax=Lacrimispora sp. TaxID=2719234 RepID=UPI0028B15AE9|nr:hypothetical protein [Lacrimispora sp.]